MVGGIQVLDQFTGATDNAFSSLFHNIAVNHAVAGHGINQFGWVLRAREHFYLWIVVHSISLIRGQ